MTETDNKPPPDSDTRPIDLPRAQLMIRNMTDQEIAGLKAKDAGSGVDYEENLALIARDPETQRRFVDTYRVFVCGDEPTEARRAGISRAEHQKHPGAERTVEEAIADFRSNHPDIIAELQTESRYSGLNLTCESVPMSFDLGKPPSFASNSVGPGPRSRA